MSVLAVDIGSSRIKAQLAGWDGRLREARSVPTPRRSVEPGEATYPVDEIAAAVEDLIVASSASALGDAVDTLVFSCLGTAMAPMAADGRPLAPALAPADTRPRADPAAFDTLGISRDELRRRTGSDPEVPSFLSHAMWWRAAQPAVLDRTHRFRSLRGYVLARLCGADAEDRSWASRTMLFDLESGDWSSALIDAAGLPAELFPPVAPSTATFPVDPAAVGRLGLAPGARGVLGAMDNGCSHLGAAGADRSGLVDIVGTYEHLAGTASLDVARQVCSAVDGVIHAYPLEGQYIVMTRVHVGESLSRVADAPGPDLDILLDGLSVEPTGLTVALDPQAVSAALAAGRTRAEVLQGLIESSTAVLARFADAWAARGLAHEPIAVVGGGARQSATLQLKASLLRRRLVTLASGEAASLGALRLAAMAVQGMTPADACQLFDNPVSKTVAPSTSATAAQGEGRTTS